MFACGARCPYFAIFRFKDFDVLEHIEMRETNLQSNCHFRPKNDAFRGKNPSMFQMSYTLDKHTKWKVMTSSVTPYNVEVTHRPLVVFFDRERRSSSFIKNAKISQKSDHNTVCIKVTKMSKLPSLCTPLGFGRFLELENVKVSKSNLNCMNFSGNLCKRSLDARFFLFLRLKWKTSSKRG